MARPPMRNLPILAGLIAACFAMAALGASRLRVTIDHRSGGHIAISLTLAFASIAFDFGHFCPKSNGCGTIAA
ncbi:MAG: hypothetical protein WDN44_11125 [Sphingomonas sp.]